MNITENISLKGFNTFGIDVRAKYFAAFDTVKALNEILNINAGPAWVLGGGSNVLFTKNIDKLVLKNEITGIVKTNEDDDHVYIRSGAGEGWHRFVLYCLENNYAGVENLALIPGNVGASPMQNIGAYGTELKDVFYELEAFNIQERKMSTFNKNDCRFGYRDSIFKNELKDRFIICSVGFKLKKKANLNMSYGAISSELESMKIAEPGIRDVANAVMNIRKSKLPDPAVIGNAGSFFKNPEISSDIFDELKIKFPGIIGYHSAGGNIKVAAGWLIEQCGWKGHRRGDAGCHEKQALVLINYGNATGAEILELSKEIMQSVQDKFGILLEREVNII